VGIRNDVQPAVLLLKAKSLPVCPFPAFGFSDAGINALQAQALYFCTPCATTHARGGRQARGSSERLTTGGWCAQESSHSPGEARKSAGLRGQKSAPSRQIGLVLRLRLVCLSNTPVFGLSQLEIRIGNQEFTFQIGQFWNVKPVPTQNPIHLKSLERRWEGFAIQSKKMDWTCDLERPVEMLLHGQSKFPITPCIHCSFSNGLALHGKFLQDVKIDQNPM
jgi:hypothetical protein